MNPLTDSAPIQESGPNEPWNDTHDVIVVGSGAAGLTAAIVAADLGLCPIVIESCAQVGGTTAVSGGAVWVPANHLQQALGHSDSLAEARLYLEHCLTDAFDGELVDAYLETGPDLIRYLELASKVIFRAGPLPDYYSNLPGGKDRYRALDPLPLPARALGSDIDLLRPPHPQTIIFGATFTTGEVAKILRKEKGWIGLVARRMARHYLDLPWLLKHGTSPRLTLGNALIGRLLLSLRERNVPILTETRLMQLVAGQDRIEGIVAVHKGRPLRLQARHGVILAGGGFGSNPDLRTRHLTRAPECWRSVAPADINTGEAIMAGMAVGAATRLMDEAWWIPVYRLADAQLTCGMFFDRAFPGSMVINGKGARFMNDAANYDETGRAMANAGQSPGEVFHFIFDERYRRSYIAGPLLPMPRAFDALVPKDARRIVISAPALPDLASRIGIDPEGLTATVARYNDFAASGVDADFHRGVEAYERHYSDPKWHPNSTLGPISQAPFHAIAIHAGDIGTKGGLATNANAQVLDAAGKPLAGLYAAGSSAASMMGRSYPAGGVTIGPAMVFGARAAMHIAGKSLPGPKD